ncbi:MAG TPA: hypothetical protein VKN74_06755 [Candidatus Mcinerneyibacterium sp.]|nr:hypothetical protein [Candidatus Mcinerneyibacterium sp.]
MNKIKLSIIFIFILFLIFNINGENNPNMEEKSMTNEKRIKKIDFHKKIAIETNNKVWNYLTKENRTEKENHEMITAAYTSFYHWNIIGKPINTQRGYWLISHVFSVIGKPDLAIYYAERCMNITKKHNFVDFDLAYAYEALARAYASKGNSEKFAKYYKNASEAGKKIEKKENKTLFMNDLKTGPWYNMK